MIEKKELQGLSSEYLRLLEVYYLGRWRRQLTVLNETTEGLWIIREVIEERNDSYNKKN